MDEKGWVRIWRKLQDHKMWLEIPFSRGQAWVDMIMTANHKDMVSLRGNTSVEVKRGQILTSQLALAKRWGWSRKRISKFIQMLSKDLSITLKTHIQKDKGYTLITLVNYLELQEPDKAKGTTKGTTRVATKEQLKHNKGSTNNNVIIKECNKNNILRYYIALKGYSGPFDKDFYSRNYKAINLLLTHTNEEEKIKEAIRWASEKWPEMWKLETVVKNWPDFEKISKQPEGIRKYL